MFFPRFHHLNISNLDNSTTTYPLRQALRFWLHLEHCWTFFWVLWCFSSRSKPIGIYK